MLRSCRRHRRPLVMPVTVAWTDQRPPASLTAGWPGRTSGHPYLSPMASPNEPPHLLELGFLLGFAPLLCHRGEGDSRNPKENISIYLRLRLDHRILFESPVVLAKMAKKKNPLVFLDVSVGGDRPEKMVLELFSDVVPKIAENFRALCTVCQS